MAALLLSAPSDHTVLTPAPVTLAATGQVLGWECLCPVVSGHAKSSIHCKRCLPTSGEEGTSPFFAFVFSLCFFSDLFVFFALFAGFPGPQVEQIKQTDAPGLSPEAQES